MEIKDIKNPDFLKELNIKELESLSSDIRDYIIKSVSKTGGHLSSNLGIVDLTIALHKVFDTPRDKIIFDVSHQCYAHKILTGRADRFDTLRQSDGLSGFQKVKESVYDAYEAGHSSTSISAALGMALARDKNGEDYNVIAIIGDGSMGNGIPYEAINHAVDTKTKLIIILNDNEMSISKNVGGFHNHLDRIRSNYNYNILKDKTKLVLDSVPVIGKQITSGISNVKDSLKKIYLNEGFLFEELGVKYYGPINGHDFNEMIDYLEIAREQDQVCLLHVITEKGKGYKFCEEDTVGTWHGVGPFDYNTGEIKKSKGNEITWSEVISNHLIRLTSNNKNIVAITPAMAGGSKLLKYKELFPDNFYDVGIAEEHALLMANGMSMGGLIPFVSIYSTFLQRGYDEVIHDIARMNNHVIIGVDRAGIVGEDGETHQGIYDLTFLLPIPNMVIATPKDSIEAGNILYTATRIESPFAIRYSRNKLEYIDKDYEEIKIGSWEVEAKGNDLAIITYGDFVNNALEIKEKLKDTMDIEVINARFQKPIDEELYMKVLKKFNKIVIYEEATKINSLGSYLINYANDLNYKGSIKHFAIPDEFILQGKKDEVIKKLGLDVNSIIESIK